MMPAVSQPAVPPPTMTSALTGCMMPSEVQACSHCECAPVIDDVQDLLGETPPRNVLSVVEVQRLEEHIDVLVDVVAGGEVYRLGRLEERRLRARGRVVLRLPEEQELLRLPVEAHPRLESMRLVEADDVHRVAYAGQRELIGVDVRIVWP